jgi:hypothetical protein
VVVVEVGIRKGRALQVSGHGVRWYLARESAPSAMGRLWRDQDKQANGANANGIVAQSPPPKTAVAEVNSQEKQPNNVAEKERAPLLPSRPSSLSCERCGRREALGGGSVRDGPKRRGLGDLGSHAGRRRVDESVECPISSSYANPPPRTSHAIFSPYCYLLTQRLLLSSPFKRALDPRDLSTERQN